MKKLNANEMRSIEGGKIYHCLGTNRKSCWYYTPFSWNLGWHFIQCHGGLWNAKNCYYETL